MLSSWPSTPTMPPCAHAVAASFRLRLARTTTGRVWARFNAAVRPARPAPTITTGKDVDLESVTGMQVSGANDAAGSGQEMKRLILSTARKQCGSARQQLSAARDAQIRRRCAAIDFRQCHKL